MEEQWVGKQDRADQESKATTPAMRSGAVRKRVSGGSEGSNRGLERRRWKPGFGQAEKINFVVKYKVFCRSSGLWYWGVKDVAERMLRLAKVRL